MKYCSIMILILYQDTMPYEKYFSFLSIFDYNIKHFNPLKPLFSFFILLSNQDYSKSQKVYNLKIIISSYWEVNYGNKEDCQSQNSHSLTNPSKNNEERKKRPDNGKISQRLKLSIKSISLE